MSFSEKRKEMREQLAKDAIYEAAVTLIGEQGFDHLTMNDIAQKTGMATGTIYNYFANKEDLLVYIHSRLHEIIIEKSEAIAWQKDCTAIERLDRYVHEMASFCLEHQVVFNIADKLGIKDRVTPEEKQQMLDNVVGSIKRIIDDGISKNEIKHINSAKVSKVFFFALIGAFEVEFFFNYNHLGRFCEDLMEIFSEYLTVS